MKANNELLKIVCILLLVVEKLSNKTQCNSALDQYPTLLNITKIISLVGTSEMFKDLLSFLLILIIHSSSHMFRFYRTFAD